MNPLTNVKNINKLNETELARGTVDKKSWHDMYKESAWIFIGGLAYGLTEGDILSVFSQYGEIVNINLIRDSKTGKIKGFCFLCYTNQKSTILAVDNLNGIKLCGRTIRVDHVANYKPPKDHENDDEITKHLKSEGCAPKPIKLENTQAFDGSQVPSEKKKSKKVKKEKKKHKKKRKHESKEEPQSSKNIKEEKVDPGYSKYEFPDKEKSAKRRSKQKDSSDSESSSGSESSDSYSSRKNKRFRRNIKQSEKDYKEKSDSHNKTKDKASNAYKSAHGERVESNSDSHDELDKQRFKNKDYLSSTSKSKSYQSSISDPNRKRNHSKEIRQKDQFASYDRKKCKYSPEQDRLASKRYRHYSHSSSASDVSDKPKARVTEKDKERHSKEKNKHEELGKSYDRTHKRYESSHRHRNEADYEKNSRHERYH